jgi:hypothetical protein
MAEGVDARFIQRCRACDIAIRRDTATFNGAGRAILQFGAARRYERDESRSDLLADEPDGYHDNADAEDDSSHLSNRSHQRYRIV